MEWTPEQDNALRAVRDWLQAGKKQVFRLFGYAGTGKTTLARHFAEGIVGDVAFGAYTGKAAHVMRSNGCEGATTIHSMIYRTTRKDGRFYTVLNPEGPAAAAQLIIIDECSMVDAKLGKDLMSFRKPILVLGDPMQLPPVRGEDTGFFTLGKPDVLLTKIHRQNDDLIILMARWVRAQRRLPLGGDKGKSRVVWARDLDPETVLEADQVLVGMNDTRQDLNARIRELMGRRDPMPIVGDKLVCLRNNHGRGLLNGGIWTVGALHPRKDGLLRMDVIPEFADDSQTVSVRSGLFNGHEDDAECADGEDDAVPTSRRKGEAFTYGYALTVHKAQGSQWDNVVLFDESSVFGEFRYRWLYTGITRASKRITIVTPHNH